MNIYRSENERLAQEVENLIIEKNQLAAQATQNEIALNLLEDKTRENQKLFENNCYLEQVVEDIRKQLD
jgi:cell division protein FtsL